MNRRRLILVLAALVALPLVPSGAEATSKTKPHHLKCFGMEANVIGTSGNDVFPNAAVEEVPQPWVIVGLGGNDIVDLGAPDSGTPEVYFCGGDGKDRADGVARFNGMGGRDTAVVYCGRTYGGKSVERVISATPYTCDDLP